MNEQDDKRLSWWGASDKLSNAEKVELAKSVSQTLIRNMDKHSEFRESFPTAYVAWVEMLRQVVDVLDDVA